MFSTFIFSTYCTFAYPFTLSIRPATQLPDMKITTAASKHLRAADTQRLILPPDWMSECKWMEVMSDPCPRMLRLKQPSRSHPRESAPHCGKKNTPDMSGPAAIHPSIPSGTLRLHWPAGRCMWAGRNPPPVWSLAGRAGGNLNTTALFPLTLPLGSSMRLLWGWHHRVCVCVERNSLWSSMPSLRGTFRQ